jgi:hypothetical protein
VPTVERTRALVIALAIGVLGFTVLSQTAGATHVRPKGASPIRISLVPAYEACATSNSTHGAPLAFPSCNPPVQSSNFLTVGTPDANGAEANSVASALIKVKVTSPEAVLTTLRVSDVRCLPGTAASVCNGANAVDGPDYSGQLQMNATIRISDHYNGSNLDDAATVQEIPFPVNVYCHNTTDTSTGGLCDDPGPQCVCPPPNLDGLRSVVGMTQFEVSDGGPDGQVSTNDNTVFLREGVFIP